MSDDNKYTLEELLSMLAKADECLENITYLTNSEIISICVARKQVVNKLFEIRDNLNDLLAGERKQ